MSFKGQSTDGTKNYFFTTDVEGAGLKTWFYVTTDSSTTVAASGYIDEQKFIDVLDAGDHVWVFQVGSISDSRPIEEDFETGGLTRMTIHTVASNDGTTVDLTASNFGNFPGSSTDNAVVRWDGTGGVTLQDSSVLIDDSDNMSGVGTVSSTGDYTLNSGYLHFDTFFGLKDANGNAILTQAAVTNAVNYFHINNAVTTSGPVLNALGSDSDIDINLTPKGSGVVNLTSSLTLSGTVDGRDVAADGAVLDTAILDGDFSSNGLMERTGAGTYDTATNADIKGFLNYPTSTTDNTLPRFDGTTGDIQTSSVAVDDSNNVTGVVNLTSTGVISTQLATPAAQIAFFGSDVTSGTYTSYVNIANQDQRIKLGTYYESGVGQYSIIDSTNTAESVATDLSIRTGGVERVKFNSTGATFPGTAYRFGSKNIEDDGKQSLIIGGAADDDGSDGMQIYVDAYAGYGVMQPSNGRSAMELAVQCNAAAGECTVAVGTDDVTWVSGAAWSADMVGRRIYIGTTAYLVDSVAGDFLTMVVTTTAGGAVSFAANDQLTFVAADVNGSGTCNTSGTTVTRTDGDPFVLANGAKITIDGTEYTVDSQTSQYELELTASAGTQSGVAYTFWTHVDGLISALRIHRVSSAGFEENMTLGAYGEGYFHIHTGGSNSQSDQYPLILGAGYDGGGAKREQITLNPDDGTVDIPNLSLSSLFMAEKAAAEADVSGDGQIWFKSDTPMAAMFTDDAGTDKQLTATVSNIVDHAVVRGDGGTFGVQTTSVLIDDSDNVSGVGTLSMSGALTIAGTSSAASSVVLAEDTDNGSNTATLIAPAAITSSFTLTLPDGDASGAGYALYDTDGSGTLGWRYLPTLPSSTTDNTLPRFDSTAGNIQTSGIVVDDSNNMSSIGTISSTGRVTITNGYIRMSDFFGIEDTNGNPVFTFVKVASATAHVQLVNGVATCTIRAGGSATNSPLRLEAKGSGDVYVGTGFDLVVEDAKVFMSSTSGPFIQSGSGTPESVVTAPIGSLFMRTDGGSSTTLYVKESGTGNTGWVGK